MKFFSAILVVLMLAPAFEASAEPELENAIEVAVHTGIVTRYGVYREVERFLPRIREQYQNDPAGAEKQLRELETEARDRLVENQLILHEFETAGYSLPESIIDDYVQQNIRSQYSDRATLTKSLQQDGITYERFRRQTRDNFIVRQMRLKNVDDAIIISPHRIELYYAAHTNDFILEERVKLRMIVLTNSVDSPGATHQLATEILSKINEGASFADLAREFSQGGHRSEGGAWDWVTRDVLRKELDDVAFSLKPGEHSGIIETPEACYLLLVENKSPGHVRPLSEVRDKIEADLLAQEQDRLQKQWIERLKKKTFVRYFMSQPGEGH